MKLLTRRMSRQPFLVYDPQLRLNLDLFPKVDLGSLTVPCIPLRPSVVMLVLSDKDKHNINNSNLISFT